MKGTKRKYRPRGQEKANRLKADAWPVLESIASAVSREIGLPVSVIMSRDKTELTATARRVICQMAVKRGIRQTILAEYLKRSANSLSQIISRMQATLQTDDSLRLMFERCEAALENGGNQNMPPPGRVDIEALVDKLPKPTPDELETMGNKTCLLIEADAPYKATVHDDPGLVAAELGCNFEDVALAMLTGETIDGDWFALPLTGGSDPVYVPAADMVFSTAYGASRAFGKMIDLVPIALPDVVRDGRKAAVERAAIQLGGGFSSSDVMKKLPFPICQGTVQNIISKMVQSGRMKIIGQRKAKNNKEFVYAVANREVA